MAPVAARLARAARPPGRDRRRLRRAGGRGGGRGARRPARCCCSRTCASTPRRRPTTPPSRERLARPRRGLRQRRLRHRPPRPRLHRGRHALPARRRRPADDPRARDARARCCATRRGRSSWCSAASRCRTRSASSRTCSVWPTRSSSAAPWPTPSSPRAGSRDRASKGDGDEVGGRRRGPRRGRAARCELLLPTDVVVAPAPDGRRAPPATVAADAIPAEPMALDIGPRTARGVRAPPGGGRHRSTGTARWACSRSTTSPPARRRSARPSPPARAVTVAGGGDTVAAVRALRPRGAAHPREHGRRRVDGVPRGPRAARRRGAHGR